MNTIDIMPGSENHTSEYQNPLVKWLLNEAWNETDTQKFVGKFSEHLISAGFPLLRMRINIRTLHPQLVGSSFTWNRKTGIDEVFSAPHSILQTRIYLDSPFAAIFDNGAAGIRRRLDLADVKLDYPVLKDLRKQGATDYVAMPVIFSDGKLNAITFAADRPGGFTTCELEQLYGMLPVLARILEVNALRHTARTLLDTYLGKYSGDRVLQGKIKRGDSEDIHAVIWFCDLRNSTGLAESMSRQDFLAVLNDFFGCMAGAVLDHGGEVLRFIGDAALAIFPMEWHDFADPKTCPHHRKACQAATNAFQEAVKRLSSLNDQRAKDGKPILEYGVGLHVGDVTYGNIGTPERLEFTVIGTAPNEAARIQSLCKELGKTILASKEFIQVLPDGWVSVGHHVLRGIKGDRELFSPTQELLETDDE